MGGDLPRPCEGANKTGISDGLDSTALTPPKALSLSAEERGLFNKAVEVTNAAKRNGIIKKTNSDPEINVMLEENVFKKKVLSVHHHDSMDREVTDEFYGRQRSKSINNDSMMKMEEKIRVLVIDSSNNKEVARKVTESSVVFGKDASAEILESKGTPARNSAVKRALQWSPTTPVSPARRMSFSGLNQDNPGSRINQVERKRILLKKPNGGVLIMSDGINPRGRTVSTSACEENSKFLTPRRMIKTANRSAKKSNKKHGAGGLKDQRKLSDMFCNKNKEDGASDAQVDNAQASSFNSESAEDGRKQ